MIWLHGWPESCTRHFYRPQTKFAKVMFLQVSVCPHRGGIRGFICQGGMRDFIWGACVVLFGGACVVLCGGACVVLFGGHAWFYLGGHAWFYLGGMHGFIWGGMHGFIRGVCVVFSVFSDTMRYGQ